MGNPSGERISKKTKQKKKNKHKCPKTKNCIISISRNINKKEQTEYVQNHIDKIISTQWKIGNLG